MSEKTIPIARTNLTQEEIESVLEPLNSGWLVQGPQVETFQNKWSKFTGAKNSIAVTSCTSALHLSLAALGFGPGDEAIVPAFTWISTANVIEHLGGRVVFCDIDLETFNMDPNLIEEKITTSPLLNVQEIKPSFEEFSDFINYYIWLRAGRRLFDSEIKLSYNKHINKTVPDSYYVVKNTLEKDYEREIKSHQKGKSKKEMQSMVLRMMYDQADKQEGESILPENSTNESDSSSQYTEYELGNCQQVGDIYSECTKYVNDAPVSVIFCVYDVCREEY